MSPNSQDKSISHGGDLPPDALRQETICEGVRRVLNGTPTIVALIWVILHGIAEVGQAVADIIRATQGKSS